MNNCCPEGYSWNGQMCQSSTAPYSYIAGQQCPCCQLGSDYDIKSGQCIDGAGNVSSTIPCPCCPEGYYYVSSRGICQGALASDTTPVIPCITVNCDEQVVRQCATCGSSGIPIKFNFDFFKRECTNCTQPDNTKIGGEINCFLPATLNKDDVYNFRLKLINFM